jgi:hypothetical protein
MACVTGFTAARLTASNAHSLGPGFFGLEYSFSILNECLLTLPSGLTCITQRRSPIRRVSGEFQRPAGSETGVPGKCQEAHFSIPIQNGLANHFTI